MKTLLRAGAKVDASNDEGWTALFEAANNGHAVLVEELLGAGANPDGLDSARLTAADYAQRHGHQQAAQLISRAQRPAP